MLVAQLLVFAHIYGNLLARQDEWELLHLAPLAMDLRAFLQESNAPAIFYRGSLGHTPLMQSPAAKFPLLRRMVPYISGESYRLNKMKILGVPISRTRNAPPDPCLWTPYCEKPGYRIDRTPDNFPVVTFKPASAAGKQILSSAGKALLDRSFSGE
ncbi:hypothetical protein FACS1894206_04140 [Deltaproteobacteria bacterium]|nr:hypothetical protein FACS1894206_04140 [Deltaproteobacteria bacterium]